MKKIKKVIIVLAMMIAMVGFVNPMTVDASRTYKVTFRAGAHGTFAANGENKICLLYTSVLIIRSIKLN